MTLKKAIIIAVFLIFGFFSTGIVQSIAAEIGKEVAVPTHLQDGDEFNIDASALVKHGKHLFEANWTDQEGGGRPLTKGTGTALADASSPLIFPHNFNRISAPDANSCAGCHNQPRVGGGGDIVANVFVTGQRFDFATFDNSDSLPTRGAADEEGKFIQLQTIANSRNTLGMFGSGYIEMLSRQITTDLQSIRNSIVPGGTAELISKGITFGILARNDDGSWDTSTVTGLLNSSLTSSGDNPPSLIIKPFHQAGGVTSLREFTNNAFNHHHGIQSTERFGIDTDPDGDGFANEITGADITAVTLFQAQLSVPGRVIPSDQQIQEAVSIGEKAFKDIGCASCHVPELPLDKNGWIYTEPNPFNPSGNQQSGDVPIYSLDLNSKKLDEPRLKEQNGVVMVPVFTDFKLHDITSGPDDPNREPIDQNAAGGSTEFFAGNSRFMTRKLWGVANEPPYFHHGQYTTMRKAIEAHRGDALDSYLNWTALSDYDRDSIIEFLKTLQILPEGTKHLIVDERGKKKKWPK
ncbi:MAG: di-heme oxidoredictase family protein [Nitrosomonas sp.]|nr:di-heme oxidoredictase family protein [Nitrosomonas sp.]MDP1950982.1 di-heme oxidoredictase family protein [Nitrosomonas sp.]